jgi:hypothetical protein
MDDTTLILALLPVGLVLLGLEIFALIDLIRRDKRYVQGENKWIWALIIIFVSTFGPVIYLLAGRREIPED